MSEYRSVAYGWMGRGWTQEISWLRIDGQEQPEWKGKRWTDYLNQSAREGWELAAVAPLGGGEYPINGVVAYFKRTS